MYKENPKLREVDVFVLCGGRGTRIYPVLRDVPKILAPLGEETFLDLLLGNLLSQGFERVILGVGYLHEKVREHVEKKRKADFRHTNVVFSYERQPLGTGGAVKNAAPLIRSENFVVLNGDSVFSIDFSEFYSLHREKNAVITIALARTDEPKDYGHVELDGNGKIQKFNEKNPSATEENLVNAGAYFMQRDIFSHMPGKDAFSLEHDVFPTLVGGACYGFVSGGKVIDIGTPERYCKTSHADPGIRH